MQIGLPLGGIITASVSPTIAGPSLESPVNLYTASQSDFSETSNIDLRANWTVAPGDMRAIIGNGSTNDVRISFDAPLVQGNPHIALWNTVPGTTGMYKPQFGGAGLNSGSNNQSDKTAPKFHWAPGPDVTGAFTRFGFNPASDDLDVQITDMAVYDLGSVDPNTVACDVVLCLGDSNMSQAVSEFVTDANLTAPFDPRVFYMPGLRIGGANSLTSSLRHVPQPCIEPVQASSGAQRMSPLQAFGVRFAPWSAARGRPLLLLSLGDPGSGLRNTEDWVKGSPTPTTGARMYNEMLAMLAAMRALGPAHEVVGAIVSLGANDTTGADYNVTWVPAAQQFVADLRAEPDIGDAALPICWITVGEHFEPIEGEDRGARMVTAIESLAEDSDTANAVSGVTTVRPPVGNELSGSSDPHFNAAGMQANGTAMADGLMTLLG